MARVLYAWELGGGMGHIARAGPIINGLRDRGHQVFVALRDLARAPSLLDRIDDLHLLQSPLWQQQLRGAPESATLAELLLHMGFGSQEGLEGLTRGWRALFDLVAPALLIVDHAPTALLAARGMAFKRVCVGTGFFSPPRRAPLPLFRTWETVPADRIASADRHACNTANTVLTRLGAPPLRELHELFDVDEDFLCTLPELDHYPGRTGQRYWGPAMERERGIIPAWPAGDGPRVFVYVNAESSARDAIIAALQALDVRALLYMPGLGQAKRAQYQSSKLNFADQPVHIAAAMTDADALLGTAGIGTVAAALLAGVPVLALAMNAEQYITALNVHRAGVGLAAQQQVGAAQLTHLVSRLLNEPAFRANARAFAQRHVSVVPEQLNTQILNRCDELM